MLVGRSETKSLPEIARDVSSQVSREYRPTAERLLYSLGERIFDANVNADLSTRLQRAHIDAFNLLEIAQNYGHASMQVLGLLEQYSERGLSITPGWGLLVHERFYGLKAEKDKLPNMTQIKWMATADEDSYGEGLHRGVEEALAESAEHRGQVFNSPAMVQRKIDEEEYEELVALGSDNNIGV